jgi:hypothetical protein
LWKTAKDRIAKKRNRIQGIDQICIAVVREMTSFDSDLLERLARSFTTRMDLCIKAKGGSIKC